MPITNKSLFRDYELARSVKPEVAAVYKLNHEQQTYDLAVQKSMQYSKLDRGKKSIWQVLEILGTIVDDSDPDTDLSQIQHALQSAEAARKDHQPNWFILTCLIHDLGKLLVTFGEPQHFVVGDTFPLGLPFSSKIVYHEYFACNPDTKNPKYNNGLGMYTPNCGLDSVVMSFGHDEYLYHVVKKYLPEQACFIIRYHSFYAGHTAGEYKELLSQADVENMKWLKEFNKYDLYPKSANPVDLLAVKDYYQNLIAEFFPPEIDW
ncbi:hypothetical protein HDV04_004285 [Boothiomyces sp. JEL0838]|nr:hypothetical protein HDV04_004285 [Boothiomyces sp. JEL0838]